MPSSRRVTIVHRYVSAADPIETNKYPQRKNSVTVEDSYRHLPARGSLNTDFDQQDDEAEISYRQAYPRNRSRADNQDKNIESNETRIRNCYRHVEGVNRDRVRFDDHRNEGGSPRERSYQAYHSTYRPASRESSSNTSPGQGSRRETASVYSRQNNPWLSDTFRSYQVGSPEENTSNYRQAHPRAENSDHSRQAYPRDQDAHHFRPAYSKEEDIPCYRRAHLRERGAYPSPQASQGEQNTSPSYQREQSTYHSHQTNAREKETSHSYHANLPRRHTSHSRHTHPREKNSNSSRDGRPEEEDTYHSRHTRPREENTYDYRQAHPREENFHHRYQTHSKEEDTYNSRHAHPGEEDTYGASPAYPRDSDSSYSSKAHPQEENDSNYDQAHPRKKKASHTHKAPRRDQDPSNSRQAHSGGKKSSHTSRDETKPSPPRQPAPKLAGDLYKSLKVSPDASHDDIVYAARKRRIEVHPDRRKLPAMSPSEVSRIDKEAQEVGLAADTLCDAASREKYDRALRRGLRT